MTLPSFLLKILFYLSMLKTIWDFASFTDILLLQRDISTLIIKSNKIRYRLSLPNYLKKKGYIIYTNICVFIYICYSKSYIHSLATGRVRG